MPSSWARLSDGFATGLGQSDGFLFEFFGVGFLNLCHVDPFPDLLEYISALLTLPNRSRVTDSTIILTALGVDQEGHKEVLALRACAEEDKDGWTCLLLDLRSRGATHIDLIVTDGHEGLLVALAELFPATPRQRCLVHKQRNVLHAIPRRERGEVQAELVGIWEQPTKQEALTQLAAFKAKYRKRYPEAVRSLAEDEEHLLTFYQFPAAMHRHIQTTNAIESLWSLVRQRTDQIDVFTTEDSCLTIVWATIQDIRLHKVSV